MGPPVSLKGPKNGFWGHFQVNGGYFSPKKIVSAQSELNLMVKLEVEVGLFFLCIEVEVEIELWRRPQAR
jgi:hypothetical protein